MSTVPESQPEEEFFHVFSRDWLDKGNIWVFDQPPPEYLKELGAIGSAFSVYYIGFNDSERGYVENLHRHGFKVTSNLPCGQSATTENLQLREEACQRDAYGNPVLLLGLEGLYDMCGNNPLWRDFLMNRIAEQARGGVDGILLDEPGDTGDCFCDYCMRAFNDYLAEHYSSEELQQLFGINDLADDSQLVPVLRGLGIDLGLQTNAAEDLGLVVYRRNSSLLVHMINYRYDRGAKDFLDLTNVEVTLTIPEGVSLDGKQLKIISPDEEERVLDFVVQEGRVTFTVPNVHCYSVASFE